LAAVVRCPAGPADAPGPRGTDACGLVTTHAGVGPALRLAQAPAGQGTANRRRRGCRAGASGELSGRRGASVYGLAKGLWGRGMAAARPDGTSRPGPCGGPAPLSRGGGGCGQSTPGVLSDAGRRKAGGPRFVGASSPATVVIFPSWSVG